jgi:hypothetical protein
MRSTFRAWLLLLACGACAGRETVTAVVTTSTAQDGWAVNYPKQHKLFEVDGRLWLFYSDGVDAVVRTSSNATAWSPPQVWWPAVNLGHRFSLAWDGTFFHVAMCTAQDDEDVLYRRATPLGDTLQWDGPASTALVVNTGHNAMYPKVLVDSGGHPWVGAMVYQGGFNTGPYDAVVVRSQTTDGTFAADQGFPFVLVDDAPDTYPDPMGVPLLDEKVYWLFNTGSGRAPVQGRLFDGATPRAPEEASGGSLTYGGYHAVGDGDDIHLVAGSGAVRYRKRDGSTGTWSPERVLTPMASGHAAVTLLQDGEGVCVTWLNKTVGRVETATCPPRGPCGAPTMLARAGPDGFASNLGINLNTLPRGEAWETASVFTLGEAAPFTIMVAGRQR